MQVNLRWYDVDKDTVPAHSPGEARRIVERVKAYKKGVKHENIRQDNR